MTNSVSLLLHLGTSRLVTSAGMPRSGSTLLYNILRELLQTRHGDDLGFGWISDLREIPRKPVMLLKTHEITTGLRLRSTHIFYTYRDVRTALVSAARKFQTKPELKLVTGMIRQYQVARKHATLIVRYEDLIRNPCEHIRTIADRLGVDCDAEETWRKLESIDSSETSSGYDKTTLLHSNHRTGTTDDDWRATLDPELVGQIAGRYGWWLRECGYPLD